MSAGPRTNERNRGLAEAISLMHVNPAAFSIWAWIPIFPADKPQPDSS